ncbi:MAG: acyltransferase [Pseudobutyrivibrio sp.]|nr:acyltransferase [Pseudobutyrivibrio sp.]
MNVFKRLYCQLAHGGVLPIEELRRRGMRIGENCFVGTSAIDYPHAYLISLGDNVTISAARLLTHDASTKRALGYSRVGRIDIGNNVFVGADATILPNVKIGDNVIIGAGSVVTKDIPSNSLAVGNPARVVGTYDDYIEKNRKMLETHPVYNTYEKTQDEIDDMRKALLEYGIGFDL